MKGQVKCAVSHRTQKGLRHNNPHPVKKLDHLCIADLARVVLDLARLRMSSPACADFFVRGLLVAFFATDEADLGVD